MLTYELTLTGRTTEDVTLALEEASKGIRDGCYTGSGCSDDGSFSFTSSGEAEEAHVTDDEDGT